MEKPVEQATIPHCQKTSWNNREAYVLGNDLIRLVTLTGGGHLAELSFAEGTGFSQVNPYWNPPWPSIEPDHYQPEMSAQYGPAPEGRLLSGIHGHNICLDEFGPPSEAETALGLTQHGEAAVSHWKEVDLRVTTSRAALTLGVRLPVAGLDFQRELRILKGESVVYVKETVVNRNRRDHYFDWQQHVTLAPPFLSPEFSRIAIPATRGKVYSGSYDGKELLKLGAAFRWPEAPGKAGGVVDLSRPLTSEGHGLLATVLIDPRRSHGYIAAWNLQQKVLIGYCFSRRDFPWVALWEENKARNVPPWSGRIQTRGLEFGSAPFPVTRREALAAGRLFGTRSLAVVSALATTTLEYLAFLAPLPADFAGVADVKLGESEITIDGGKGHKPLTLKAGGLKAS
jgi:hypothetical protein